MSKVKLLDLNNDWKQARPILEKLDDSFIYSGYQHFKITKTNISPISHNVITKFNLVKNTVQNDIVDKTVSDVGCSNMFFGFYSYLNGASKVVGVDLDKDYISMSREIIKEFSFDNIAIKDMNVADYKEPADTVFAFAIIHWVYSCSGFLGSLENVIKHFREITKQVLYIEWIDPTDDCIADMLHHLDFNKDLVKDDYSKQDFLQYLQYNFADVEFLGISKHTGTREIYRCVVK